MSRLVSSVDAEFSTDFAILQAIQEVRVTEAIRVNGASSGSFAGTSPGAVSAICGTKYAQVRVRAERWDARPAHARGWEDADELPFAEVPGAGPLTLGGFDDSEMSLDIDGLGRARVLVQARGRQRYAYSDYREGLAPEEWLLQFFPDPESSDALAGDPRRLAGQAPFGPLPKTGWFAAMHAWSQTGWHHYLYGCPGFYETNIALSMLKRPVSRVELARETLRFKYNAAHGDAPVSDSLSVALRPPAPAQPNQMQARRAAGETRLLAELASLAGLPEVVAIGDFIDALHNIGLLLSLRRGGAEVLVPNACPGMIWDVVDIPEENRRGIRQQIGYADFRHVADDIQNILAWAPDRRLTVTPRTLAIRLAVTPAEVIGGLDLLDLTNGAASSPVPTPHSTDSDDELDVVDQLLEITIPRLS